MTILAIFILAFASLCSWIGVIPAVAICAVVLVAAFFFVIALLCWAGSVIDRAFRSNGLVP